jgi:hypothetical protein
MRSVPSYMGAGEVDLDEWAGLRARHDVPVAPPRPQSE